MSSMAPGAAAASDEPSAAARASDRTVNEICASIGDQLKSSEVWAKVGTALAEFGLLRESKLKVAAEKTVNTALLAVVPVAAIDGHRDELLREIGVEAFNKPNKVGKSKDKRLAHDNERKSEKRWTGPEPDEHETFIFDTSILAHIDGISLDGTTPMRSTQFTAVTVCA
jgi:hypothetical protein